MTTRQTCYMRFPDTLTTCSESDNQVTLPSALTSWAAAKSLRYKVAHISCTKDRLWNEAYTKGKAYTSSDPALTGDVVLLTHSGYPGSGITADNAVLTLHWAVPGQTTRAFGIYIESSALDEWQSKCDDMGIDLICPLAAHALGYGKAEVLDHVPDMETLTDQQDCELPKHRPEFVGRVRFGDDEGELSQTWPSLAG